MRSRLFTGHLYHSRLEPVQHAFRYPVYVYALDLDELPQLKLPLFGYNRPRPASLYDDDYLERGPGPLKAKVLRHLARHGIEEVERIDLVTSARWLGYAFNPVSFYYCWTRDGRLRCCLAEVNNTFGERYLYVLDRPRPPEAGMLARYTVPKGFYVSPFNAIEGDYDFHFGDLETELDVRIHILQDQRATFRSRLRGTPRPLDPRNHLRTLLAYPVNTSLTLPRIMLEAARLHYQKGLPPVPKPFPTAVLRAEPPGLISRLCLRLVDGYLSRIRRGRLTLILPDGSRRTYGQSGRAAEIRVNDFDFFRRLVVDGDVGLGEAYQLELWDSPDVTAAIRLMIDNRRELDDRELWTSYPSRWLNRLRHLRRSNPRENVRDHYDLGNEFFQLFLDRSMTYSCALFRRGNETLEEAQEAKLIAILDKARVSPHHHLLEIGSGWGSFAMLAARRTGCRVTTVTLSAQQYEWVRRQVREHNLEDRVNVAFCDFRQIQGTYDRIVSIEMLEAVGHARLGAFFAACDRLLAPDGLLVLQVISIPDQGYEIYRRSAEWTQKYIFPGSCIPSLTALTHAMTKSSSFLVEHLENIGVHYARTLREWRSRFLSRGRELEAMGFGRWFQRTWDFYFSYCEAGFATRTLGDLQLVLTRVNNPSLPGPP